MKIDSTGIADLKRLPPSTQDALLALQAPADDRFVFLDRLSWLWYLPIFVLLGWLIYVLSATQQPRWDDWMFWLIFGLSIVISTASAFAAIRVLRSRFARLKNGYMFTQNEFFRVADRRVECRRLSDLDALRYKPDRKELEVWIGEREIIVYTDLIREAQTLEDNFDGWRASAVDELGPEIRGPEYAYSTASALIPVLSALAMAVIIGLGFAFGASYLNRRFDDEQLWQRVLAANSTEQYEAYKAEYPHGIHAPEADEQIAAQVRKLKDQYLAKVPKAASPDAVAAMAAAYDAISRDPKRTIYVKLSETRDIDPAIVPALEAEQFVRLNPYDDSIPISGEPYRKQKMFSDVKLLFAGNVDRSAVHFELVDDLPADAPSIEIKLGIRSEKIFYRITSYDQGEYVINNYPGGTFTFDFALQPSGGAAGYSTQYVGRPAVITSSVYDRRDKDNYSFDKIYFSRVMADFDGSFAKTFGFAEHTSEDQ